MQTVVITGASRGIGLALARAFSDSGSHVIAGVRDPSALVAAAQVLPLDVTDDISVRRFADALEGRPVDLLINNAGVIGPPSQSALDMDFVGFLHALDVNTLGPLRVTQALLPALRRAEAARVLALTSAMGSLSYAKSDRVAYRASKAAANKVVQCLATDLAPEGIAVAAVHPGWARTELGGPDADLCVQESTQGVHAVAQGLTLAQTGRFWGHDGGALAW